MEKQSEKIEGNDLIVLVTSSVRRPFKMEKRDEVGKQTSSSFFLF
jgi:hypothetical protein